MRFALLGFLAVSFAPAPTAAADPPGDLRIGMVSGLFRDQKPAMVQALAKPFRDLMGKHVGLGGDVEVVDDPLALCEHLKDGKVQLGVFHGFEFAWAQQRCDELVPLIVTQPPGVVRGLVVVPADSKAKSVADLTDAEVRIPRGAKAHSLVFFDKLRDGLTATTAKPSPKPDQTAEEVLTAVANGDAPAALVDAFALEGYKALHPGGFKALKVLAKSEEFPPAVVCYRKGSLSDAQVTAIRDGLTASAKSPTGKVLMTLWNLKGFEAPPKGYQASLDDILKAYPLPKAAKASGGKAVVKDPGGK